VACQAIVGYDAPIAAQATLITRGLEVRVIASADQTTDWIEKLQNAGAPACI